LARGLLVVAAAASVAFAATAPQAGAATHSRTATSKAPVELRVHSPGPDDIAGKDGAGFVVDLALRARTQYTNSLLSPEAGYKPFLNNPAAPTFAPGTNGGAPGLVVTLSTTPTTPGTSFQGPDTNLAGLFQVNGVATSKDGRLQTTNTWQIGKAAFGSGPATLTAYVVKGAAPAVVPARGLEKISNTVKVSFTITAATATAARAAPANATLKLAHDANLGAILVDSSGRTVYLFEKDQGTMTACTGACASAWPALSATGMPTVGEGLDPSKVGSANGQVTYAGHLLYHYAGDGAPGDTNGAGIPGWDAVAPSGALVHART
jgi:predicted lipoprotein with Yx(FWY)xxD motif